MIDKYPCRAVQYHAYEDLEDGFVTRYINPEYPEILWKNQVMEAEMPVKIPYIYGSDGEQLLLREGQWIVKYREKIVVMNENDYRRISESD